MFSTLRRLYKMSNPPEVPKNPNALRLGILSTAGINVDALLKPARSHPDVVVCALASRDPKKASIFAEKNGIEKIYSGSKCYEELIEDPEIDTIYNPLPNALHFEYTMRALAHGKHVLVEKPIADTSDEAQQMIDLAKSKGLVLLEAIHYTFHPALQRVKDIIDSGELGAIKSMKSTFTVPSVLSGAFGIKKDLSGEFKMGRGATMDLGVYPLSAIRYFSSSEPVDIQSASAICHPHDPQRLDRSMRVVYQMPNSVTAETHVDFCMPGRGPFGLIQCSLNLEVLVELEGGSIKLNNFVVPHLWHTVEVRPNHGRPRFEKVYKFKALGEEWWSTYRYQLEAFVAKVQGGTPQAWPFDQESVFQVKAVEEIYRKAGLPARPASTFRFSEM